MMRRCFAVVALVAAFAAHAADNPALRYRLVSAPDCPGPVNIIAEETAAPPNQTHIRVQHMGDRGAEELAREVSNEVTWDVGSRTGLHVAPFYQRGYRDVPNASAFQLACDAAGFFINSFEFGHSIALFGEGPSATVGRTLDPEPPAFDSTASMFAIEARVAVPTSFSESNAPDVAVTQVSFLYYARDTTTGALLAHVIGLHDSRPPGVAGAGEEFLGYDGFTAFAGSPLASTTSRGAPVRFVRFPPYSGTMRHGPPWPEPALFRADIEYDHFKEMLEELRASALPGTRLSTEPLDYRIVFFGVLAEVFVGTTRGNDVMLGGHVRDLTLLRERSQRRFGLFR